MQLSFAIIKPVPIPAASVGWGSPLCIKGRGVLQLSTGFTGAMPTVLREHSQKHAGK